MLTWVSQQHGLGVQWLPISLNLIVHTIMYYYYAQQALGIKVWWKKWLTTIQIIQFVLDIMGCYAATVAHYLGKTTVIDTDRKSVV